MITIIPSQHSIKKLRWRAFVTRALAKKPMQYLITLLILIFTSTLLHSQEIILEAEEGQLQGSNSRIESSADGFSGTGYVTGFEASDDGVVVTADMVEAGEYTLSVGFSTPYGPKDNYISINGEYVDTLHFPELSGFSEVIVGDYQFDQGENTIGFHQFWGWCFVDYFKITDIAPRGDFTIDPAAVATGDTITFDASGTFDPNGTIVSYQWDFGDGATDTGKVVEHIFNQAGLRTITLLLTDNDGNNSQIVKQIDVSRAEPFAVFEISEEFPEPSVSINFDGSFSYDLADTIESWEWNFGDGESATGEMVSHTFDAAGNYQVSLTVTNGKGKSDTRTKTIFVYALDVILRGPALLTTQPKTHEKIEMDFQVKAGYDNPYDPEQVQVDAVVTHSSNQDSMVVPCFYYEEVMFRSGEWEIDSTIQSWRLRFSVEDTGEYTVRLKYTGDSVVYGTQYPVHVSEGNTKGIIRNDADNKQYYRHATGEPYYPLGINIGWNNIENYANILTNISEYNGNFFRYWHTPFANQALEWSDNGFYDGLGVYSQRAAGMTDSLLNLGKELGVYMQLVMLQHGPFSENVNPIWNDNPYNSANGGFVNDAEAFFYNNDCKRYIKKLFRYIIARWGYSPNIYAWEFFNEVQFTGNHPNQSAQWYDAIGVWHSEMSRYVESIDPFDHIMTTSAADDQLYDLDSIAAMDVIQYHLYNENLLHVQKNNDYEFLENLTKPIINGEYGENVNTADVPLKIQQTSLWNGILTQVPHIMWLWDNYHKDEWGALFLYPSLFLENEDFAKNPHLERKDFTASMGETELITTGLGDDSTFYGVVYHPNEELLDGATIDDLQMPFGNYDITYYLASAGEIIETEDVALIRAHNKIHLPQSVNNIAFKVKYKSDYTLPIALAGPDQLIPLGSSVTLDGSASLDPNELALNYDWEIVDKPTGSSLTIINNTSSTLDLEPDVSGFYYLTLTVDNGTDFSIPDTVVVISSTKPVANAGPDQTAAPRESVLLDGSASSDADGEPITFLWEIIDQPNGSDPSLFSYQDTVSIFRANELGEYWITLVVDDGIQPSDPDTVKVTVENPDAIQPVLNNDIKIYPNPAKDKLQIELGSLHSAEAEIIITDMTGKIMMRTDVSISSERGTSLMTLDISALAGNSGAYLLYMNINQTQYIKYVLIE